MIRRLAGALALTGALGLAAAGPLAAPAAARLRPQRLRDVAPASTTFLDRVVTSSPATATARAAATGSLSFQAYATPDGYEVPVAFSPSYTPDPSVAQSYVSFLDSLPHGSELGKLQVLIAPPDEVQTDCGGQPGTLACYVEPERLMIVPGSQPADSGGVTVSYVITHEYGHHVAAFRTNAPFSALDYGPKYWASYERVCAGTLSGALVPGDEAQFYIFNPGEDWAEAYARLTYPDQAWTFAPQLKPDAGALVAARRDVLSPWTGPRHRTFTGRFTARGPRTRTYAFDLTLDGSLKIALAGPRRSNYNLTVTSDGRTEARTRAAGSRDTLAWQAACRTRATEHVRIIVHRIAGSGPFSLHVTYDG